MAKKKQYDTYILMTEDKEVVEFGPGSQQAAQQYAVYHARQLGKAVFYARVEGVAGVAVLGEIAKLEEKRANE